jgi:hypothetical protein
MRTRLQTLRQLRAMLPVVWRAVRAVGLWNTLRTLPRVAPLAYRHLRVKGPSRPWDLS